MSGSDSNTIGRRRLDTLLEVRIWWPHPPLGRWIKRWRARGGGDRRYLSGLSDHALRDLGLDRTDVETESTLSYWRQP